MARLARLAQWHDFFPLWPRKVAVIDGHFQCAWLQTVERRGEWGYLDMVWEYRLKAPK
jgi:hypothetical protein